MTAPQKKIISPNVFFNREIPKMNYHNGYPWPRIDIKTFQQYTDIPLTEDYTFHSMDYLDTAEALPIFEKQAEIIIKHNYKNIIDVGCRIGRINEVLHDMDYTDYNYMGFDTSREPILYANALWEEFNNIEYRQASWENKKEIAVDFQVDCVIWSASLLYAEAGHMNLFEDITSSFYKSKGSIIQEPCEEQPHDKWIKNLKMHTIEPELHYYSEKYDVETHIVNADIFSGKRKILDIQL